MIKTFVLSIIASASLISGGDDGWYPVEKAPKAEEASSEIDPSIWVLFSKSLDFEKILVRLPEDPTYRYTETGDLVILAKKGGEVFELTIQKNGLKTPQTGDSLYESEGKWVHEHVLQTQHHVYLFRTISLLADSPNHKEFVSSFSLQ